MKELEITAKVVNYSIDIDSKCRFSHDADAVYISLGDRMFELVSLKTYRQSNTLRGRHTIKPWIIEKDFKQGTKLKFVVHFYNNRVQHFELLNH